MPSALGALANAVLKLQVPAAGTTVDATTGNVLPQVQVLTYSLFAKQLRVSSAELPGVNTATAAYEGYCVNPQALDASVTVGTLGTLSFAGGTELPCMVKQVRHAYGAEGLLGTTLQQALGDRIRLEQLQES